MWFYVYAKDKPFSRAYSPNMKSKDNVLKGKRSIQFEIYYTNEKPLGCSEGELKNKDIDSIIELYIAKK